MKILIPGKNNCRVFSAEFRIADFSAVWNCRFLKEHIPSFADCSANDHRFTPLKKTLISCRKRKGQPDCNSWVNNNKTTSLSLQFF